MADRTEDLKFGSYALTPANGVVLESWRDRYLHKATFRPKLKGGGGLKTKDQVHGIEVKMSGRLIGNDTGQLDTRLNDLVRNLSSGEDWLSFYTTRRLRCALVGNVQHQLQRGAPTVRAWSATMRSERQYWESDAPTTDVFTPSGAGPDTFVTSSVGGEAPVPPIVKIKNTGGAFTSKILTLTYAATLESLQFIGLSLFNDQEVVIDMAEQRLGDGIATAVTPLQISGHWFELASGAAATLELAHNVGAGASWSISVEHRPRFYNP
jgi:hypothetical protein